MTTITIQINDNRHRKRHAPKNKQTPQIPWAIAMGQDICPPGDQFRFI